MIPESLLRRIIFTPNGYETYCFTQTPTMRASISPSVRFLSSHSTLLKALKKTPRFDIQVISVFRFESQEKKRRMLPNAVQPWGRGGSSSIFRGRAKFGHYIDLGCSIIVRRMERDIETMIILMIRQLSISYSVSYFDRRSINVRH